MADKIKCKNCGAEIDENISNCPYCGELNYKGAEKQYMNHLGDIKDSLKNLSSESTDEIVDELTNVGRTLKRSFIIIGVIILIFGGLYVFSIVISNVNDSYYESTYGLSTYKDKVMWLSKYESELNEMYDNGEFEKILEFEKEHQKEKWEGYRYWKHNEFIELYGYYSDYNRLKDIDNYNSSIAGTMLYDAIKVQSYKEGNYTKLTKKEAALLDEMGMEMNDFYKEYLGIEGKDVDDLIDAICHEKGNYYVDATTCARYAEEMVK